MGPKRKVNDNYIMSDEVRKIVNNGFFTCWKDLFQVSVSKGASCRDCLVCGATLQYISPKHKSGSPTGLKSHLMKRHHLKNNEPKLLNKTSQKSIAEIFPDSLQNSSVANSKMENQSRTEELLENIYENLQQLNQLLLNMKEEKFYDEAIKMIHKLNDDPFQWRKFKLSFEWYSCNMSTFYEKLWLLQSVVQENSQAQKIVFGTTLKFPKLNISKVFNFILDDLDSSVQDEQYEKAFKEAWEMLNNHFGSLQSLADAMVKQIEEERVCRLNNLADMKHWAIQIRYWNMHVQQAGLQSSEYFRYAIFVPIRDKFEESILVISSTNSNGEFELSLLLEKLYFRIEQMTVLKGDQPTFNQ